MCQDLPRRDGELGCGTPFGSRIWDGGVGVGGQNEDIRVLPTTRNWPCYARDSGRSPTSPGERSLMTIHLDPHVGTRVE